VAAVAGIAALAVLRYHGRWQPGADGRSAAALEPAA